MASTAARNKNLTRPRKGAGAKRRRQLEQRRRLVDLGMDESEVKSLNAREVLDKLKHPKKVQQEAAKS